MNKSIIKLTTSLVLVSLLLSGCKQNNQVVKQPELLEPVNVSEKYEQVTYRDVYSLKTYKASVVPYIEDLYFEMDDVFDQYHVTIGDEVKKGQKLASLSDEKYEEELQQYKESYEQVKIQYNDEKQLNQLDLEIIDEKIKKEKSSLKEASENDKVNIQYAINKLELDKKNLLDASKLKYVEFDKQLSTYNDKINDIKKKMESNSIVAPFDGIVAYIAQIDKGSIVSNNKSVIKLIDNTKSFVTYQADIYDSNDEDINCYAIFNGKRYEIDVVESDPNDKSAPTNRKYTFKNSKDQPKHGTTGVVCIISDYRKNVLSVSNKAINAEGMEKQFVYCKKDNQKQKVYVNIGVKTDIYTEIKGGLQEGDEVLSE